MAVRIRNVQKWALPRQFNGRQYVHEMRADKNEVRNLQRDISARSDRYAHIRLRQS